MSENISEGGSASASTTKSKMEKITSKVESAAATKSKGKQSEITSEDDAQQTFYGFKLVSSVMLFVRNESQVPVIFDFEIPDKCEFERLHDTVSTWYWSKRFLSFCV